jgi:hypothetical protein
VSNPLGYRNCLSFTNACVHPRFLIGSVLLILLIFCVVCLSFFILVLFVFVLSSVPNVACVFYCPFVIAPSVFSNIYMYESCPSILDCPFGIL